MMVHSGADAGLPYVRDFWDACEKHAQHTALVFDMTCDDSQDEATAGGPDDAAGPQVSDDDESMSALQLEVVTAALQRIRAVCSATLASVLNLEKRMDANFCSGTARIVTLGSADSGSVSMV